MLKRILTMENYTKKARVHRVLPYEGEMWDKIFYRLKMGYTNTEIIDELHLNPHKLYKTARQIREEYGFGKPTRTKALPSREICKSCIYKGAKGHGCDFYYWTGNLRGCEAGEDCKRYKEGVSIHKIKGTCKRKKKNEA